MGLLCVIALTIGYLFLFPTIVWDISLPDLIDIAKDKSTGASIEAFLKKYNFINQTSADYANDLILITVAFTFIFFIMGLIIVSQIKAKRKMQNDLKNISHKIDLIEKDK